ncbi:hypothetical protein [Piscinibacter sp. XHJ-5]|uniref:hypothetical protein n=1 Tax=Piscinibacter sp. XHJ-5 TaxID=3037797 RepID=UPI002452842E|nr:hypothetical protein [Piscinibacter sp. XHJ-5]
MPVRRHSTVRGACALTGLTAVAAVALALAGCGGRPDDADEHDGTAAAAAAGPASPRALAPSVPLSAIASSPQEGLGQIREQLHRLRSEVADLRQRMDRIASMAKESDPTPADPRGYANAVAQAEQVDAQRLAASESAFRGEPADVAWGQRAMAAVRDAFAQGNEAMVSQIGSIECRSRSCRVELGPEATEALAHELPMILGHLSSLLPHAAAGQVDQGNGRQSTLLYLSR